MTDINDPLRSYIAYEKRIYRIAHQSIDQLLVIGLGHDLNLHEPCCLVMQLQRKTNIDLKHPSTLCMYMF